MNNQIVYLTTYNYIGLSLGANHYYGELRSNNPYTMIELKKLITKEEAIKLNKKIRQQSLQEFDIATPGEFTKGFNSEEEVRTNAQNTWQSYFPNTKILLEGHYSYHEPKLILFCEDEKTKDVLNTVFNNLLKFKEHDPNAVEIESFEDLWFVLFDLYRKRIGDK